MSGFFRVVGIDPSITATGIADEGGATVVKHSSKVKGDKRLVAIRDAVFGHVFQIPPVVPPYSGELEFRRADLVVMEDMPINAQGAGRTGMVHGIIRELCARGNVPVLLVPPATLKKYATNKGNAKKPEMIAQWNAENPTRQLTDDNAVDASFLRQLGQDMDMLSLYGDEGEWGDYAWRPAAMEKLFLQWDKLWDKAVAA